MGKDDDKKVDEKNDDEDLDLKIDESDDKDKSDDNDDDDKPISETEEIAVELGWSPNYKGPNAVSAREFILNSKDIQIALKNSNKQLEKQSNKKIERLEKGMHDIKEYYRSLDETRAKKAEKVITRLRAERDKAIEEGDIKKVKKLDGDIEETKKDAEPLMDDDIDNPDFDAWHESNNWYGTDTELTEYADAQSELEKYAGVPYKRMLNMITKNAKELFPEKFETDKTDTDDEPEKKPGKKTKTAPKVEPTTRTTKKTKKLRKSDLDPEMRDMMKNITSVSDVMTEKEFLAGLSERLEE